MFREFLSSDDARRVLIILGKLWECGFRDAALAGGLATEIHLRSHRCAPQERKLNDVDLVVESFASIPQSLADRFLFHHIHPHASEGKLLAQLVEKDQHVRIDLFRQFGSTLARAEIHHGPGLSLRVISLEDIIARTTSLVSGAIRRGDTVDPKYVRDLRRLAGLGDSVKLDAAWRDHGQSEGESFPKALRQAQLIDLHPGLLISEQYSAKVEACPQCQDAGTFRRTSPVEIVDILGYW